MAVARRAITIWVSIPLGVFLALLWLTFMPHMPVLVPQEVARARVVCGELVVTQTFTATVEPYIVWLYFRAPGEVDWAQYFVDFEAPYWWGSLEATEAGAKLTFYGGDVGRFTCKGPTFELRGRAIPTARRVAEPFDAKSTQRRPLPAPAF